jgi:hypothetical protein
MNNYLKKKKLLNRKKRNKKSDQIQSTMKKVLGLAGVLNIVCGKAEKAWKKRDGV